ncbi:MAG: hypothetical protein AAFX65_00590 [Cyanobacteria bacterium J06638_7]
MASGIVAGAEESIVNRCSSNTGRVFGVVYSSRGNRPVALWSWRFWYLQRSKRVWFQLDDPTSATRLLLFRFDGRPILHRSQVAAWQARHGPRPAPVVWGKWPGVGLARGPRDCQLFLTIWSRWSWLHPRACGRPGRFSVEPIEP